MRRDSAARWENMNEISRLFSRCLHNQHRQGPDSVYPHMGQTHILAFGHRVKTCRKYVVASTSFIYPAVGCGAGFHPPALKIQFKWRHSVLQNCRQFYCYAGLCSTCLPFTGFDQFLNKTHHWGIVCLCLYSRPCPLPCPVRVLHQ